MATGEARIKSLYAGLYRTIVRLGLLITAAWVFAAFSFYLSRTYLKIADRCRSDINAE